MRGVPFGKIGGPVRVFFLVMVVLMLHGNPAGTPRFGQSFQLPLDFCSSQKKVTSNKIWC